MGTEFVGVCLHEIGVHGLVGCIEYGVWLANLNGLHYGSSPFTFSLLSVVGFRTDLEFCDDINPP